MNLILQLDKNIRTSFKIKTIHSLIKSIKCKYLKFSLQAQKRKSRIFTFFFAIPTAILNNFHSTALPAKLFNISKKEKESNDPILRKFQRIITFFLKILLYATLIAILQNVLQLLPEN